MRQHEEHKSYHVRLRLCVYGVYVMCVCDLNYPIVEHVHKLNKICIKHLQENSAEL
jgi:hypothetical protein